jgi:hypothetical protein
MVERRGVPQGLLESGGAFIEVAPTEGERCAYARLISQVTGQKGGRCRTSAVACRPFLLAESRLRRFQRTADGDRFGVRAKGVAFARDRQGTEGCFAAG